MKDGMHKMPNGKMMSDAEMKKKHGKMDKEHPGFQAVQGRIAKRMGVSKKRAGAILAKATRKASKKAKAKNPRLRRVKG